MSRTILYVYAIGRGLSLDNLSYLKRSIDGMEIFSVVSAGGLDAVCTPVDSGEFSQFEIDRRSTDLQWLGTIGYRHEAAVSQLAQRFTVIPLRAFTLFSTPEALTKYLSDDAENLKQILKELEGKEEWTIRVEFDPEVWQKTLARRVESLRALEESIASSPEGKAYLLSKKLDEERKKAAQEAEQALVGEIEQAIASSLDVPIISESRQSKSGSFPQINLLLPRERSSELRDLHQRLLEKYKPEGVSLALTGPWPPYTFASGERHG